MTARRCLFVILASFVLTFAAGPVSADFKWHVSPGFGMSLGETEYILRASGIDSSVVQGQGTLIEIRSQLEYPLNVFLFGVRGGVTAWDKRRPEWSVEAGVFTNIGNPSGAMKDHDWLGVPSVGFEQKFSYTESDAKMRSIRLELAGTRRLASAGAAHFCVLGGFIYQRISQDLIGFEGWYTQPPSTIKRPQSGTGQALDYIISYYVPYLGGQLLWQPGRRFTLDGRGSFTFAFASDQDDHVLRGKLSTANTSGPGVQLGLRGQFDVPLAEEMMSAIGLDIRFLYIHATGTQTQTWYREETINGQTVPKGTTQSGIDYETNTTQIHIGLAYSLYF